ncbi:glycosyltransferase [Planomonospora sp. ID91781]|uniref:glycosyltransferase n=1 Tax=Planomonospora sp. ID91781 TaxID=2738135 RepID=UPI0018C3B149|nr:glycosyltransferase [Planomonospora sp. ID91781]MBG0820760.1 glycosyltransferase [Planomonospora sp. ID91781]
MNTDPGKAIPVLGCHIGFEGYPEPLARLREGADEVWTDLDGAPTDRPIAESEVERFLLLARTPADLRRAVPLAALLPEARTIVVVVSESPRWRPAPVPVADNAQYWRRLLDLRVRRGQGDSWRVETDFARAVPSGGVLKALARGLAGGQRGVLYKPVVSLAGVGSHHWRPGDPNVVPAPVTGPVPARRAAPGCDLVLRTPGAEAPGWQEEEGGPAPIDRPVSGEGPGGLGAIPPRTPARDLVPAQTPPQVHGGRGAGPLLSVDDLPPVDELSVCPIGFAAVVDGPLGELREGSGTYEITARGEVATLIAPSGALTEPDVARVRELTGVAVDLDGDWAEPYGVARVVCGLAAAGVPVVARPGSRWSGVLGAELAALLNGFDPAGLSDPLTREQFSIRLRRSALGLHSVAARWRALAVARGLRPPDPPTVSVLLCTRRPELVGFALGQIARQRGVETEVVLTLHGFTADLPGVAEAVSSYPGVITVIEEDPGVVFGDVLNRAARRASGQYLTKMDDDDWYGPDHLADLLLAQSYSGADLVGAAPEFFYLAPIGTTVRREFRTELYSEHVAGSSILVSRGVFDGVGGFRPISRTVDGQLLESVSAAGGRIYRCHGLNYLVSRRSLSGHTWQEPLSRFLQKYRQQWRGLYANALMEMEGDALVTGPLAAGGTAAAGAGGR